MQIWDLPGSIKHKLILHNKPFVCVCVCVCVCICIYTYIYVGHIYVYNIRMYRSSQSVSPENPNTEGFLEKVILRLSQHLELGSEVEKKEEGNGKHHEHGPKGQDCR